VTLLIDGVNDLATLDQHSGERMHYKALSNRVKKHKANKANNNRLHEAAEAYLRAKNGPEKPSFRKTEEIYGVKKSTLERFVQATNPSTKAKAPTKFGGSGG